jgi:hypothetical protein
MEPTPSRPHLPPGYGIEKAWLEDQLLFSTHPETITARNLQANPALAVHLESGDRVAIVEGAAMGHRDRDRRDHHSLELRPPRLSPTELSGQEY